MQLLLHVLNAVVVKQFEVLASRYGRHRVGAVGVMLVIIIASVIWGMSKSGISVQKGTYVGETSTGVKILLTIDADHSTLRVGHDAYDLKIVGSFQDGLEFACYCQDTDGLRGAMMVLHGPFVDRNGLKLIVGVRGLEAAVDMQRDYTYYAGAK